MNDKVTKKYLRDVGFKFKTEITKVETEIITIKYPYNKNNPSALSDALRRIADGVDDAIKIDRERSTILT